MSVRTPATIFCTALCLTCALASAQTPAPKPPEPTIAPAARSES